jgi:hypothetical protein
MLSEMQKHLIVCLNPFSKSNEKRRLPFGNCPRSLMSRNLYDRCFLNQAIVRLQASFACSSL